MSTERGGDSTESSRDPAAEKLRRRISQLEFALETTDAVVWDWDIAADTVEFVPSAQTLYDAQVTTVDEFLAQIHPDDRQRVRSTIETALEETGEYAVEFRIPTYDGLRWVADRGRVQYDGTGTPVRMTGVAQDITARKRHAQLVTNVLRHTLRTEMTVIRGHATSLGETFNDATTTHHTEAIKGAAEDLVRLSESAAQLADIIQPGRTECSTVDVCELLRDLVADFRQVHPDAVFTIDAPERLVVRADETLRFVLQQAIENAVVHNDTPTITVALRDESPPTLTIADDGTGIPELELETLEGATPVTELTHGSGLGLRVIKWGIEALGGDLSVSNADTGGTALTVELPPKANQPNSQS